MRRKVDPRIEGHVRVAAVFEKARFLGSGTILHPSPASPAANRGWAEQAEKQLIALGVL